MHKLSRLLFYSVRTSGSGWVGANCARAVRGTVLRTACAVPCGLVLAGRRLRVMPQRTRTPSTLGPSACGSRGGVPLALDFLMMK